LQKCSKFHPETTRKGAVKSTRTNAGQKDNKLDENAHPRGAKRDWFWLKTRRGSLTLWVFLATWGHERPKNRQTDQKESNLTSPGPFWGRFSTEFVTFLQPFADLLRPLLRILLVPALGLHSNRIVLLQCFCADLLRPLLRILLVPALGLHFDQKQLSQNPSETVSCRSGELQKRRAAEAVSCRSGELQKR